MAEPMFMVLHFFGPPDPDGGGVAAMMGYRKTLEKAIEVGSERLLFNCDKSEHDRIQIRRRKLGGEHPTWLYRDRDDRVCMWRKRPEERFDLWGFSSGG